MLIINKVQLIKEAHLFQNLNENEIEQLAKSADIVNFPENHFIFKEGDQGNYCYIIILGSVRVTTHSHGGKLITLARLEAKQYFGEQALKTNPALPRNANVQTLEPVSLLQLSHKSFFNIITKNKNLYKLLGKISAEQLSFKLTAQLQTFNKQEKKFKKILENQITYDHREIIFRQADVANQVYYLINGQVEIRIFSQNSRLSTIKHITPGQFFGEYDVLHKKPRAHMAVALNHAQVITFKASEFINLYKKNRELQLLVRALNKIYKVPLFGKVTQYHGNFLEKPALYSTIELNDGTKFTSAQVIDQEIFAISENQKVASQHITYQGKYLELDIKLDKNDHITQLKCFGQWKALTQACILIFSKHRLAVEDKLALQNNGEFSAIHEKNLIPNTVCQCMHISYDTIQQAIKSGINNLTDVCMTTGAGTVCGGCRPLIIEMLGGTAWFPAKISKIIYHNNAHRSYQLKLLSNNQVNNFIPGQHLVIQLYIDDFWITRSYTLTSTPQDDYYEITIKKESQGVFSKWLFTHDQENILLRISEPQGDYHFHINANRPALCLMGGIGITPAIAFARALESAKSNRHLTIIYSLRHRKNIIFEDELKKLAKLENINLQIHISGEQGRLNAKILKPLLQQQSNCDIYLCGPEQFITSLQDILTQLDISNELIHIEKFIHSGGPTS